jgi:sepiapterin reductase
MDRQHFLISRVSRTLTLNPPSFPLYFQLTLPLHTHFFSNIKKTRLQPFDCWSMYCTGKAARDMYFKSLALEEHLIESETSQTSEPPKIPRVKVLSYAPGPLDTDMQKEIREQMPETSSGLRKVFKEMHEEKKLVDPLESAKKLVGLLVEGKFVKGEHVDYFDV